MERAGLGRRWGASLLLLGVLAVAGCEKSSGPSAPPASPLVDLGEVAEFSLLDQEGRPFQKADLEGFVWVVDFIFTNCPSFCPKLSADMRTLAHDYRDESRVRFLSLSVDPERDTPEVLKIYAANYAADPERWYFLTGDRRVIADLTVNSFLIHSGMEEGVQEDGDIGHSDRFCILDAAGHLRAFPSKSAEERVGADFLGAVRGAVDRLLAGEDGSEGEDA